MRIRVAIAVLPLLLAAAPSKQAATAQASSVPQTGRLELLVTRTSGTEKITAEVDFCELMKFGGFEVRVEGQRAGKKGDWILDARSGDQMPRPASDNWREDPYVDLFWGDDQFWSHGTPGKGPEFENGVFRFDRDLTRSNVPEGQKPEKHQRVHIKGALSCPREPAQPVVEQPVLEVMRRVAGDRVRPYATYERGRRRRFVAASAIVEEDQASKLRDALRKALPQGQSWQVYLGNPRFLPESSRGGPNGLEHEVPDWWGKHERWAMEQEISVVELTVIRGQPADVLRAARSPSTVTAPSPIQASARVREWDRKHGVEVISAYHHGFTLRFLRPPKDVKSLIAQIRALCEDAGPLMLPDDESLSEDEAFAQAIKRREPIVFPWHD